MKLRYNRLCGHWIISLPRTEGSHVLWVQRRLSKDSTGLRTLFLLVKVLKQFGLW